MPGEEVAICMVRYLSNMEINEADMITSGVKILSNTVRDKEVWSLNKKKEHVLEKNKDCRQNKLCQWMRSTIQEQENQ